MLKNTAIIFLFIFIASMASPAYAEPLPLTKSIQVGISQEDFKKIYPALDLSKSQQWQTKAQLNGLQGKWTYTFKDNQLEWYSFSYYVNDFKKLTEENFNLSLAETKKIITQLTALYGKPVEEIKGKEAFTPPPKHWGYDVIETRWTSDKEKISARFKFFGGKGQYFFVVETWFHAKNHAYWQ